MKILFIIILICSGCASNQIISEKTPIVYNSKSQAWNYPGKFYPQVGEFLFSFNLQSNKLSNCKGNVLKEEQVGQLSELKKEKELLIEEYRNFLQLKISGIDFFYIKSDSQEIAANECKNLQEYLIKTFNFSNE